GRPPRNLSERLVTNAYEAMQFVEDRHHREPLSVAAILRLHHRFTRGTTLPPRAVGMFQAPREPRLHIMRVWTGRDGKERSKILFKHPPAKLLPQCMKQVVRFANGDGEARQIHPVVRAALVRFFVIYLSPFLDANARVAQAVVYWT